MDNNKLEALKDNFSDTVFPEEFLEQYELLECFSHTDKTETLLVRKKPGEELFIAKCYYADSPLFSRIDTSNVKDIAHSKLPHYEGEFSNENVRCILWGYIPGQNLEQYCREHKLSEDEVRRIALQLCEQLKYLHSLTPPVIHRDIKPQNVIRREDGSVSLIDFDIARPFLESSRTETYVFGTKDFAPPEQYGFSQPDVKSDIYSLGVLMQWLLHKTAEPIQKPASPFEKVIAKCMSFDPNNRFASDAELLKALKSCGKNRTVKIAAIASAVLAVLVCAACMLPPRIPALKQKMDEAARQREISSLGFTEELIYEAARSSLDLEEETKLTPDMLGEITEIYIVGSRVASDIDDFNKGCETWYTNGRRPGPIESIDDLRLMPKLKLVYIAGQKFTDISVVSRLSDLEEFEIKGNNVSDISALSGLPKLKKVGINATLVTDISPLLDCPQLALLDIRDVSSYDPSVFARLGDFDFLDISNRTDSYRYLSGKHIRYLKIANNDMDDLSYLNKVYGIEELDIDGTRISDLSPIVNHSELRVLNIRHLEPQDLSVLRKLLKLQTVYMNSSLEEKAKVLEGCPFEVIFE